MAAADVSKSAQHIAEAVALGYGNAGDGVPPDASEAEDTFNAAVDTISEENATTLEAVDADFESRIAALEATVDTAVTGLSAVVADHEDRIVVLEGA